MILHVDGDSPVPPYEQIRIQMATMIQTGTLEKDARLPAIRQLAADLGLASGTVARAYRELEAGGYIQTRRRHGTFVLADVNESRATRREKEFEDAARALAVHARQLGIDPRAALKSLGEALETMPSAD